MTKQAATLAFIFPGQGSQTLGMLAELAQTSERIKETFDQASELFGDDLWDISQHDLERLNDTRITQPVMLAAGVAVWRVWCDSSTFRPGWMAGHSLGEYTALVCAGKLDFSDAVKLVTERAQQMQLAVPAGEGAMAALIGLSDDLVAEACHAVIGKGVVEPANFNAPGQVVIAGHRAAVNAALEEAKQRGAKKAVLLPVSVPSHCPLMEQAAQRLSKVLQATAFHSEGVSVLQNVSATAQQTPEQIRSSLEKQLYQPVQWVKTIQNLQASGVQSFVECGPGKVLSGLVKRISKDVDIAAMNNSDSLAAALEQMEKISHVG